MDDELRGVKGWLLTFVIIISVVSPAYSVYQITTSLYGGQFAGMDEVPLIQSLRTFEWSLAGITTLLCWFIAWRLVAVHNWTSVRIAIAGIWIAGVGGAVAEFAGVMSITGVELGDLIAGTGIRAIVQPFIFGLIWTSYLLKSERVQNTYRNPEEQAEVFE